MSFNNAIKETIVETLQNADNEIVVRDLYDMNFNPVLTRKDLQRSQSGNVPEDIKTEQEYIKWADIMTFVYPIWWTGLPAFVKGYIDRVFLYGFAYSVDDKGIVKLLKGKKAIIFNTHGLPESVYAPDVYNALNITSNGGIFDFCGFEVLDHNYFSSVPFVTDAKRKEYLAVVKQVMTKYV